MNSQIFIQSTRQIVNQVVGKALVLNRKTCFEYNVPGSTEVFLISKMEFSASCILFTFRFYLHYKMNTETLQNLCPVEIINQNTNKSFGTCLYVASDFFLPIFSLYELERVKN